MNLKAILLAPVLLNVFLAPEKVFSKVYKNADYFSAFLYFAVPAVIVELLGLAASLLWDAENAVSALFRVVILSPLEAAIRGGFGVGVYFVLARLLGGKESFKNHFYATSILMPVFTLVFCISALLASLLFANPMVAALPVVVSLTYYQYVFMRTNHKLSRTKAVIAASGIIGVIAFLVIIVYMFRAVLAGVT